MDHDMTGIEIARLAAALNVLRPDWPTASVQTFIEKELAHRPLHDTAVALTWIATDPDTKTPRRVLEAGPWWATSRTTLDRTPPVPPCDVHGYTARRPDHTYPCCDDTPEPQPVERQPTPPPRPLRQLVAQHRPATPTAATEAP